jgi:acyl-coenzyme A thioesterase PaaI-like protein
MPDLGDVQQMLTEGVPFNRVLGIRVASIAPDQAEVTLPAAPERENHVGTVHAAAQFGLGEAASGAMVVSAFGDLQAQGYVPLAAGAQIVYRHPARGNLLGVATLAADEQRRIRAEVDERGKARFTVAVQLFDAQDAVVSEVSIQWVLVRQRS